MAKLRKMLGDINSEVVVSLMRVIETQSKETLANWAIDYAEKNYLCIYEKECAEDMRFREVIAACRDCLAGNIKLKDLKPILKEGVQIARETENPVAQAAARAVDTACRVIQTPTNALGFTFYGAAAVAYHELGLEEPQDIYDALADREFQKILESLKERAVENEENPAKIKWGC